MNQLFGSIRTASRNYEAMLCRDSDQPEQATLHFWGHRIGHKVLSITMTREDEETFTLRGAFYLAVKDGHIAGAETPHAVSKLVAQKINGTLSRSNESEWHGQLNDLGDETAILEFKGLQPANLDSMRVERCGTWLAFTQWAAKVRDEVHDPVFRGHGSRTWSLESTLHRAGRTRLERYFSETLRHFKDHAEATLGLSFDLSNPNDTATLLGLAQHHGLPTPLLDFTESPYVAAYFAFSDALERQVISKSTETDYVRIYALSRHLLNSETPFANAKVRPYMALTAIPPRYNQRLYAQQGLFLATNVSRVEDYLIWQASKAEVKGLLCAIEIPASVASAALRDLKYMGLSAATLFPGLDGTCRMFKQEMLLQQSSSTPVK
jgi:hypothetical protein